MKGDFAILTMVKNEAFFLPIWLKYYSQFFDADDIFILDHGSTDGCTKDLTCNVTQLKHASFRDNPFHLRTIKSEYKKLLKDYNIVIQVDADEIITPDLRKYQNLGDYLNKFLTSSELVARCGQGWGVYHNPKTEPALDLSQSLLHQRKYWHWAPTYCKPLIAKIPLDWKRGCHTCCDKEFSKDKDLYLLHLPRLDHKIICARIAWERGQSPLASRTGGDMTGSDIQRWYFSKEKQGIVEEMPEWIKRVI